MRFQVRLGDFVVQELARLPLVSKGDYAVYEVEKQNVTTLQVQAHIAGQLHRRLADVQAPALKDKKAIATQHLCVRGSGPAELNGPGYRARFVGRSPRPLRPSDLSGNRFTITLRDMSPSQVRAVRERLQQVTRCGLPNYFDKQRFGSHISHPEAPDNFIGKTILRRDAQGAVRAYLSYPFAGDPPHVRAFKAVARERWGEWAFLLDEAPRPSNYRSLLTYLKDHPQDYRKALNLIPRRLLSLYLVAYQSYLWNQIASAYLAHLLVSPSPPSTLTVLDLTLTVYNELSPTQHAALSALSISLPGHRAVYKDPALATIVRETLASEGLKLNDLKARILKRAYLPKGKRALLLHPTDVACDKAQKDDHFTGRQALRFSFSLPRGAFATWVLRTLGVTD
ncbi:MAG: tRNA pseudouridine(13) synthase TruD [Anaerolineae bacterium]|jgi:tRNA pseudouridine13 synthase